MPRTAKSQVSTSARSEELDENKVEDKKEEAVVGLGPYIVHIPFPGTILTDPADSPEYKEFLDAEKTGEMRKSADKYRDMCNLPKHVMPEAYMFQTTAMLHEAQEVAKAAGRVSDDQGRVWCKTEEEAAKVLLQFMSFDKYLKDRWPYSLPKGGAVYLDSISPKFKKSKLHYLGHLMSPEQKQKEIEKEIARKKAEVG